MAKHHKHIPYHTYLLILYSLVTILTWNSCAKADKDILIYADYKITGQVTNHDGKALPNIKVSTAPYLLQYYACTNQDGGFALSISNAPYAQEIPLFFQDLNINSPTRYQPDTLTLSFHPAQYFNATSHHKGTLHKSVSVILKPITNHP